MFDIRDHGGNFGGGKRKKFLDENNDRLALGSSLMSGVCILKPKLVGGYVKADVVNYKPVLNHYNAVGTLLNTSEVAGLTNEFSDVYWWENRTFQFYSRSLQTKPAIVDINGTVIKRQVTPPAYDYRLIFEDAEFRLFLSSSSLLYIYNTSGTYIKTIAVTGASNTSTVYVLDNNNIIVIAQDYITLIYKSDGEFFGSGKGLSYTFLAQMILARILNGGL